ncbi:MAG: hypothetical protein QOH68_3851 [Nocardioidaceae bacterium]|nr:hypothetical protein [Nocardioidaceae bacterium]
MTKPRGTGDGAREERQHSKEGDPNLQELDHQLDLRRTLNGVQELLVLSLLMLDRHTAEEVLQVLASSVESVTECALVLVLFRRHDEWMTWPTEAVESSRRDPRSLPSLVRDGDSWTCTTAVAALAGPPGQLVLRSATEPGPGQLFLIERLGHLLGAALADAELHERDRRRTIELDKVNEELGATVASLRHRGAVQESFSRLAVTGREADVAESLSRLTGRTVVVRDAFGHETTRINGDEESGRWPDLDQMSIASLPISTEESMLVSTIGGGPMSFGTITLEVSAADGSHDHDDDARFALQYASTALGLLMAHAKAMGEMENRLSRDLIEDLLDGLAPGSAVARAAAQGHDLRTAHDVVVVVWPPAQPRTDHADRSAEQVRDALHRQRKPFLLTRRQGALVILAHHGVDIRRLYEDLSSLLGRPTGLVAMGEPVLTPRQVPRAYEQARRALVARQASGEPWGSIAYSDLGVDRILAVEGNAGEVERLITQWLGELMKYDQAHGADLVPTLATYLDRGGRYDETAQALSIHRNTLRYRLSRIAEISGHDLADTETRLNLHLATRAWRLRSGPAAGPGTPSS